MLSFIKRRLTYANAAMTAALVFAMAGGAIAATGQGAGANDGQAAKAKKHQSEKARYVITSKRQISPQVLKQLQGATGPEGKQGSTGPAGTSGKEGAAGKNGENGKDGTNGTTGPAGPAGPAGPTGQPWTPNSTLPMGSAEVGPGDQPGAQETGAWAYEPAGEGKKEVVPISFPVKLAEAIPYEDAEGHQHVVYIDLGEGEGEAAPATAITEHHCAGTAEKPEAAAGYLCVFEAHEKLEGTTETINKGYGVFKPETGVGKKAEEGAGSTGAILVFAVTKREGLQELSGTWAVGGN